MNKTIKSILAGVLAGVVTVSAIPAIADTLDAIKNSVNITLNGEKVASENESYVLQNGTKVPYSILFEGTTYLPVRKLSELLDIKIGWDNDTRTVLIDKTSNDEHAKADEGYKPWGNAPDFGEFFGIKKLDTSVTVRSTTHWYEKKYIEDTFENEYISQLESLGFERQQEGKVKPKFKVYAKGNTEIWLDLGMYTQMVYGVTVVDKTRPIVGRDIVYRGGNEDIPGFSSAFGYTSTILGGIHYLSGDWHLWACIPDYFQLLESEGFTVSSTGKNFYGKSVTFKKDKSTITLKYDGVQNSNIPALTIDY